MINANNELVMWVDREDNVLGLKERREFYTGEFIHRSVGLIVLNDNHEILIAKRHKMKKQEPGMYSHSVDGGVTDEGYYICARKELDEELGIDSHHLEQLYKYYFEKHGSNKMWKMVYLCRSNEIPIPDPDEIESIIWMTVSDLEVELHEQSEKYSESFQRSMDIFFKIVKKGIISL